MAGEGVKSEELVDPDYGEVVATPLSVAELTDEQKAEKIRAVIKREFSAEIQRKEKNIEIIDERLLLAKKTLHRLRYAIVNSYYNSKEFQLTEDDIRKEVTSQKDPVARNKVHSLLKNEQKRIHPALKKLLGTKADLDLDELFKIRPPRKRNKQDAASIPSTSQHLTIPVDDNIETLRPEIKTERSGHYDAPSTSTFVGETAEAKVEEEGIIKVPRYIEPKGMDKGVLKMDLARRNKQKEKFRVIIGNTSKYTPPHSEMDRSTHRWLLYVRGPRDRPDVSHFISSVTVGLDQSYAPHNVIHLKSSPFHLSRRGWGEFPVQIRLHFKNDRLNKSVNLVHQLRLDRNYTGLQTLGAETVVDVWLYTDESMVEKPQEIVPKEVPLVESSAYVTEMDRMLDTHNILPQDGDILKEKCWLEFEKKVNSSHSGWSETLSDGFDISKVKIEPDILEINETRAESNESVAVKIERDDYSEDLLKIKTEPMDDTGSSIKRQRRCDILDIKLDTNVPQVENEHRKMTHASRSILKIENNILLQQNRKSLLKPNNQISLLKVGHTKSPEISVKQITSLRDSGTTQSHVDSILRDHCYVQEKYLNQNSTVGNDFNPTFPADPSADFIFSLPNQSNRQIFVKREKLTDKEENYSGAFAKSSHTRVILGMNHDSGRAVKMAEDSERAVKTAASIADFIKVSLPKVDCVRSAVSLMLRRMPLVHEMAGFAEFQKVFPFAVESEERYYGLGTIKRRNKEWTRAKIINNIIKKRFDKNLTINRIWTTKQIILYSHYHGYVPVKANKNCVTELPANLAYAAGCFDSEDFGNSKAYKKKIELKELFEGASIINTLSSMSEYSKNIIKANKIKKEPETNDNNNFSDVSNVKLESAWSDFLYDSDAPHSGQIKIFNLLDSSDEEIDICSTKEPKVKKESGCCSAVVSNEAGANVLPFEDEDEKLKCFFIERMCAEQGIELRNEHVGNGYSHSLAHKVILSAVRSLVEDILRRSLAVKMAAADAGPSEERGGARTKVKRNIWRTESGEVHSVSLRHVFEAIGSREELDILTNAGLGTEELEYADKL